MPSPNINATDTLEVGRQKINNHFNDATEHGGGASGVVNAYANLPTSASQDETRYVLGRATPGDGGAGHFRADPADTTTADNGGTVIVRGTLRWKRLLHPWSATFSNWFPLVGDNSTDDRPVFLNLLSAGAGKKVYIDKPAGAAYKISGRLTPAAGTKVQVHPDATIRQDSKWATVWDLLNVSDVEIEGGRYTYTGPRDTTNSPGSGAQRDDFNREQFAAVWTNSNGTKVRNIYASGFWSAVTVSGYNSATGFVESGRVQNVTIENVQCVTVDMGLVASGARNLTVRGLRGSLSHYTDLRGLVPGHLIYVAGDADEATYYMHVDECHARDTTIADVGAAYKFRTCKGLTIGSISADTYRGIVEFAAGCEEVHADAIISRNDASGESGVASFYMSDAASDCKNIRVEKLIVQMRAAAETARIRGENVTIGEFVSVTNRKVEPAAGVNEIKISGTRNGIDSLTHYNRNAAPAASRVVMLDGTDCFVGVRNINHTNLGVDIAGTAVRPRVRYDPRHITVTSATTPSTKIRVNTGVTDPIIEIVESIAVYTPASGAAVSINASNQTVAHIQQNNTAGFNINAPSQAAKGRVLRVVLINGSGGAIAPSWNAAFVFDGSAPASPASGAHKSVTFEYDGTNWREIGRSG